MQRLYCVLAVIIVVSLWRSTVVLQRERFDVLYSQHSFDEPKKPTGRSTTEQERTRLLRTSGFAVRALKQQWTTICFDCLGGSAASHYT